MSSVPLSEEEWKRRLIELSNAYYNGASLVSDAEFDTLVDQYEELYGAWTYLGPSASHHHPKAKLPVFMGSLNKVKEEAAVQKFDTHPPVISSYVLTEKLDGISLLVSVKKTPSTKPIVRLYTRGNGLVGSDVTHLLPFLKLGDIDKLLGTFNTTTLLLRGELVLPLESVAQLGENLRNIVCGAVNAKTPDANILSLVHFVAYEVCNLNLTPIETIEGFQNSGWEVPKHVLILQELTKVICDEWLTRMSQLTVYPIDGLVAAKNVKSKENAEASKQHTNPVTMVAYKRTNAVRTTTVVQVHWEMSRYGMMHPRVEIQPIVIDGCTITFVSGFHAKYILENNLGPGAVIVVQRSGEVIPNIVRVVQPSPSGAQLPEGENVKWVWHSVDIQMKAGGSDVNHEQAIARMTYSLKLLGAKQISDATVSKLYHAGLTNEMRVWNATLPELQAIDNIGPVQAGNIYAACSAARSNITLDKLLLLSACFNNFGEKKIAKCTEVIDVVKYIEQPSSMNEYEMLAKLSSVSIKTQGQDFIAGCNAFRQQEFLMQMLQLVKAKQASTVTPVASASAAPITLRAVFSGFRDKDLVTQCLQKGIKVTDGTVTKQTDCVVVKEKGVLSTKVMQAQAYNIPVYTVSEFQQRYSI